MEAGLSISVCRRALPVRSQNRSILTCLPPASVRNTWASQSNHRSKWPTKFENFVTASSMVFAKNIRRKFVLWSIKFTRCEFISRSTGVNFVMWSIKFTRCEFISRSTGVNFVMWSIKFTRCEFISRSTGVIGHFRSEQMTPPTLSFGNFTTVLLRLSVLCFFQRTS
jgi:hypothetical protein